MWSNRLQSIIINVESVSRRLSLLLRKQSNGQDSFGEQQFGACFLPSIAEDAEVLLQDLDHLKYLLENGWNSKSWGASVSARQETDKAVRFGSRRWMQLDGIAKDQRSKKEHREIHTTLASAGRQKRGMQFCSRLQDATLT